MAYYVRLTGLVIASFVIAALALLLVGSWIPQLLGPYTVPVSTFILGGLIFQDIARRDRRFRREEPEAG